MSINCRSFLFRNIDDDFVVARQKRQSGIERWVGRMRKIYGLGLTRRVAIQRQSYCLNFVENTSYHCKTKREPSIIKRKARIGVEFRMKKERCGLLVRGRVRKVLLQRHRHPRRRQPSLSGQYIKEFHHQFVTWWILEGRTMVFYLLDRFTPTEEVFAHNSSLDSQIRWN
jgi:hypothetical protein